MGRRNQLQQDGKTLLTHHELGQNRAMGYLQAEEATLPIEL